MTLVLLDTNAYLRFAKRIRPLLGKPFGNKDFVLTILPDVEKEVNRNSHLKSKYPWFDGDDFKSERMAAKVRLKDDEKDSLKIAHSILRGWVLDDPDRFTRKGRSPPSDTDCRVLAFAQIREAIVVTDDLGMHELARDFNLKIWHGWELLCKMRSAKVVEPALIREIFNALEVNGDLTNSWRDAKHTVFAKIFGSAPSS